MMYFPMRARTNLDLFQKPKYWSSALVFELQYRIRTKQGPQRGAPAGALGRSCSPRACRGTARYWFRSSYLHQLLQSLCSWPGNQLLSLTPSLQGNEDLTTDMASLCLHSYCCHPVPLPPFFSGVQIKKKNHKCTSPTPVPNHQVKAVR